MVHAPATVGGEHEHTRGRLRLVPGPLEPLLTVRQVAHMLQISTATVYKLVSEGKLAHVRVRNSIRFKPKDVKP